LSLEVSSSFSNAGEFPRSTLTLVVDLRHQAGAPLLPPHLLPPIGLTCHRYPPSTAGGDSRPQSWKPRNPKIDSLPFHKNNTTHIYNKNRFSISPGHGCRSRRRMPASTRRARAPPASTPGYTPPPPGLARQVIRRAWPPRWAPGLPRPWIHTPPYPARGERASVNWIGEEDRREGEDETGGRGTSVFLSVGGGPEIYILPGWITPRYKCHHICTGPSRLVQMWSLGGALGLLLPTRYKCPYLHRGQKYSVLMKN
jgi:hypothetical protein